MENVLKTLSGKIKKEYKDFKNAMLTETAKYVFDNAFKINFCNEVYYFFVDNSDLLLDYFDFTNAKYLMNNYEGTYFPPKILKAGKSVYIERNFEMIDKSNYCITYYDENYQPTKKRKSGTKIAYEYAIKKKRTVINLL